MIEIKLLTEEDIEKNKMDLDEILINLNILDTLEILNKLRLFIRKKMCICLGAYEKNELIGILWAYKREFSFEVRYHINYFSVKQKNQNKGIGKELIKKLKEIARKEKIKTIDLNVDVANKQAKVFYKNNNFQEEKILLYLKLEES